jgi:hypothetical protein
MFARPETPAVLRWLDIVLENSRFRSVFLENYFEKQKYLIDVKQNLKCLNFLTKFMQLPLLWQQGRIKMADILKNIGDPQILFHEIISFSIYSIILTILDGNLKLSVY